MVAEGGTLVAEGATSGVEAAALAEGHALGGWGEWAADLAVWATAVDEIGEGEAAGADEDGGIMVEDGIAGDGDDGAQDGGASGGAGEHGPGTDTTHGSDWADNYPDFYSYVQTSCPSALSAYSSPSVCDIIDCLCQTGSEDACDFADECREYAVWG